MWPDANSAGDGWNLAGPQTDGTYIAPVVAPQPVDAGGGSPANYGQTVLDVFKLGVGAWSQQQQQQQLLDYRRFEVANGVAVAQGTVNGTNVMPARTMSPLLLIVLLGGVILIARG